MADNSRSGFPSEGGIGIAFLAPRKQHSWAMYGSDTAPQLSDVVASAADAEELTGDV
jgi:hypothetical protein